MTENKPEYYREEIISEERIQTRLTELAAEIAPKYIGKHLLLIGVLKGAVIVLSDLARALYRAGLTDVEIDFVQISSYGDDTESSRNPRLVKDVDTDIYGRSVIFVEDIVDTGHSLAALQAIFAARGATSIETFALLSKTHRREVDVAVEYIGFEVSDWVDGYGLDTGQQGRANPDIVKVTKI